MRIFIGATMMVLGFVLLSLFGHRYESFALIKALFTILEIGGLVVLSINVFVYFTKPKTNNKRIKTNKWSLRSVGSRIAPLLLVICIVSIVFLLEHLANFANAHLVNYYIGKTSTSVHATVIAIKKGSFRSGGSNRFAAIRYLEDGEMKTIMIKVTESQTFVGDSVTVEISTDHPSMARLR
jgi:hypothetical protein